MAETETVRRILVSGRSEGLDKLSSELNKVRDAHEGVAEAAETSATVTERSARRQLSAQGAWDRQIARADAAVRAQQQFDRELSVATRAFDSSIAGVAAYGAELTRLQRKLESVGGSLAKGSPGLDSMLGVGRTSSSASASAAVFQAEFDRLEQIAQQNAVQIGKEFGEQLHTSLIAGVAKSARDSASVFSAELDALDRIAQQKAQHIGQQFSMALDASFGIGVAPKGREDTIAVFEAQTRELEAAAARRVARLKTPLENINKLITASPVITSGKGPAEQSMEVFAAQMDKTAAAVQRLKQQFDPLTVAEERHAAAVADATRLQKEGELSAKSRDTIIANSTKILNDTKKSYEGAFTAQNKFGTGAGLARHELINLSRQVQDVGVSLASGQSFVTVLIQQGTQMADIFASSRGSVSGFFTQLAGSLGALAPLIPVLVAAGAAVLAVYNAFSVAAQKQELSNSLLATGRVAGVTGVELNKLAVTAADSAEITATSGRIIAAEFAKTGKIGIDNMTMLVKLTKDYAAVTGQSLSDSAKELAAGLMDTSHGLEVATQKLGPLDSTTQSAARSAADFGDKLKAQKLYLDAVRDSTASAEEATSKLSQAWQRYITRPAAAVGEALAGAILPATDSEKRDSARTEALATVARLERELARDRRSNNAEAITYSQQGLDRAKANLKALEDAARVERTTVADKAKKVEFDGKINVAEALAQSNLKEEIALRLRNASSIKNNEEALKELVKRRNELGTQRNEVGGLADPAKFAAINKQIQEITASNEKLKNQAEGQSKVTEGLTAQQQKSVDLLKVEENYRGNLTAAQRIARAGEITDIENRDELATKLQAETNARIAQEKVRSEAANAHVTENQNAQETNKTFERQIEILKTAGVEKAKIADLERRSREGAKREGVGEDVVMARLLRNEAAQARTEIASGNAQRRESVELTKEVNKAAAGGAMSATRQARLENEIRVAKEAAAKWDATGVNDATKRNKVIEESVNLVKQENSERQNQAANTYLFGQQQQLDTQRKQIELLKVTRDARYEELEVMKAQQFLNEQGIDAESAKGKEILNNAKLIGAQNREYDKQLRIQRQIQQAQEFAADSVKSFLSDLLTGTDGLTGALKNLGKGFLNASLDALVSGKGPLAGITGLAAADKDGQGGLIGMLTKGITGLGKQVEVGAKKGTQAGSIDGVVTGIDIANGKSEGLFGLGISGKDLAGGLSAVAGLAGAYGVGASAGSYGQAVAGGALSGGMAGLALAGTGIGMSLGGAAVLGPIGLLVGAGLAYWGQKSARDAAKKQREEEAQENYRQAEPGIATLRSQLRGEAQDTLENRINNTLTEVKKGIDVAFFAKKTAEATALADDFGTYKWKAIEDFQRAFGGLIASLEDGLGPNSAFAQARESVKATGDSLKGFVSDAAYAFGKEAVQVEQAREAARAHALSILDGSKALSMVETRMEEVRGAGVALQQLLVELGMSATDAAAAIEKDTIAALKRLADTFQNDINSQVNEVQGYGYVNEFNSLFAEISQRMADATRLGLDTTNIQELFRGKAQDIVDNAQLTGAAFDRLIEGFPQLAGVIVEFTDGLKGAAKEADIAARKLAFLDRLFAATNDTSTLEGQLAAYNRTAQRERQEELRKGGQAISELDAAQAAERYNIIKAWNDKILDDQKRAAEEASNFWNNLVKQIKQYTDGLRAGTESPLSPQQRLAAAQSQYEAQLALARTGDRDALSGITGYHSDFMDALRDFWGSSTTFQDLWQSSITDLEALPEQVKPEDLIIDAIETGTQQTVSAIQMMQQVLNASVQSGSAQQVAIALQGYFTNLDTNTDSLLSTAEFMSGLGPLATSQEQAAARNIFNAIDANGDGMISKQENTNAALIGPVSVKAAVDATATQLLALAQISDKTGNTANLVANANLLLGGQGGIVQNTANTANMLGANGWLDDIFTQAVRIGANTQAQAQRVYVQGNSGSAPGAYYEGGYTGNYGTFQEAGVVHGQEYVLRAEATRRIGIPALDYMNDNMALPDVAMPTFMSGGGNDNVMATLLSQLINETQGLRNENARGHTQTARATLAGAEQICEDIDELNSTAAESAREARRKRAA